MGRPTSNAHIYLVDEYLQPTIPGVQTGEIIIRGKILFYFMRHSLLMITQMMLQIRSCATTMVKCVTEQVI